MKIDTSNPPGNETAAAKAIQAVLEREGIPAKLFALDPGRANLVARVKGNGSKRPLLLMGHTDVVGRGARALELRSLRRHPQERVDLRPRHH